MILKKLNQVDISRPTISTAVSSELPDRPKSKPVSRLQWFRNMPVRGKQLMGLLTSEVISVVGLVGVSSLLVVIGGRIQLLNQAKSELAVSNIAYDIKVDQMGLGFRAQSDHQVVIEAVQAQTTGLSAPQFNALKQVLQNEVQARNIEYATLVDQNRHIIANAHQNRAGETFDPEGLVSRVLENPEQIKASALVSPQELQKESITLPEPFANQTALIRYTVTPVFAPNSQKVLGVLICGDIINGKLPIVQHTLESFQSGYSAIYLRQPTGEFAIATSMYLGNQPDIQQAQSNIQLTDTAILKKANLAAGETITQRLQIDGQSYTAAAQSIQNISGEPIAILVRGTSETALNALVRRLLTIQLLVAAVALLADIVLAIWLGRTIVDPIKRLQQITQRFKSGDRQARAQPLSDDEIGQLAETFNKIADTVVSSEQALLQETQRQALQTERAKILAEFTTQMRGIWDLEDILNISVEVVRDVLQVDRVLIAQPAVTDLDIEIKAESVVRSWPKALGQTLKNVFSLETLTRYQQDQMSSQDNVETASTQIYRDFLDQLEVRSDLIVPIFISDQWFGLLCLHQCTYSRRWEQAEQDWLETFSAQIGAAMAQAAFLQQQQAAIQREKQLYAIVSHFRESLDVAKIFKAVVNDLRHTLETDRAIVYTFDDQWQGTIIAESVDDQWRATIGTLIADPCFAETHVEPYKNGRIHTVADIYQANLTDCYLTQLESFQVRANAVAPILSEAKLIGLLIIHQCSGARAWQADEITLLKHVALQLGYALEQAHLFEQNEKFRLSAAVLSGQQQQKEQLQDEVTLLKKHVENLLVEQKEASRLSAATLSEQQHQKEQLQTEIDLLLEYSESISTQRYQKEHLQYEITLLIEYLERVAQGDLTAQADVTTHEVGAIASRFDTIVQHISQKIDAVKRAAVQINTSLIENEDTIQTLIKDLFKQRQVSKIALESVKNIQTSNHTVAENVEEVTTVTQSTANTAKMGELVVESAVENVMLVQATLDQTTQKLKQVDEASQHIAQLGTLISQIATQTQLLSINTGIEAAKLESGGEQFAIAASEVGQLTVQASQATQEIEEIVTKVRVELNEAMDVLKLGATQAIEGAHLLWQTNDNFTHIQSVSEQVGQLIKFISEVVIAQGQSTQKTSELIQQVVQIADDVSDASCQVSSSLQKTVGITQYLQTPVSGFQVAATKI